MKKIVKFWNDNRILCISTLVAIIVIVIYEVSYSWPELWENADRHFYILYQLSLAVIANFLFFIFQSHIPRENKNKFLRKFILKEYSEIIYAINLMFEDLTEKYINDRQKAGVVSDEHLKTTASMLKNSDVVSTQIAFKGNMTVAQIMY